MSKRRVLVVCCLVVLGLTAGRASAALLTFTDRASWEAALGGSAIETEDFNAFSYTVFDAGTHSLGLLDLEVTGTFSPENAVQSGGTDQIDATKYFRGVAAFTEGPTLLFADPIIGFGGDWMNTDGAGQLELNILGDTLNLPDLIGDDGFFGVVSTTPFSDVVIRTENASFEEFFGLDNVSFSQSAPEPSSFAIFGLGACLACLRRNRRRKRNAA